MASISLELPTAEVPARPATSPAPLSGLKVVEIATGVAGPFCARMLADFGADVVKVELAEGDPSRTVGPFDDDNQERGALFLWLNANKRGLALDWLRPEGRRVLGDLLVGADVLVDSGPPALLGCHRLNQKHLARGNPRIITTSITPFGATGPWRDRPATNLTISALSGLSAVNGCRGREPLQEPGWQAEMIAGLYGYIGTLCALIDRVVTGEGQGVEVAALEAAAAIPTPRFTQYAYKGRVNKRSPKGGTESLMACQDGLISLFITKPRAWQFLADLFALGDESEEITKLAATQPEAVQTKIRATIAPHLRQHAKAEIFEAVGNNRANAGVVLSVPELKEDPHLRSRNFFTSLPDLAGKGIVYPGPSFGLGAGGWSLRRPAPFLGQHNEEVLGQMLGYGQRYRSWLARTGVIAARQESGR